MRKNKRISVIIPMLNEEESIGLVISAIPNWVDQIITVDNGSIDNSFQVATDSGATVIRESRRGYGAACLTGMTQLNNPDIVVFLDGDFSDYPEEMSHLVDPIIMDEVDFIVGSRVLGEREKGALTPQARFGNWLSCLLIKMIWNAKFTDLGPFRAIRYLTLKGLNMKDPNYGWTVEMQIKAARNGVRLKEVAVKYRKRIGKSKVSGTVSGVLKAGSKILWIIFMCAFQRGNLESSPKV